MSSSECYPGSTIAVTKELRGPVQVLYFEPYCGGSHAAFTRILLAGVDAEWRVVTMPPRHWKWRMRGAAVHLALECTDVWHTPPDVLFASSFVPLAEVKGLIPSLSGVPAVLYFHENQLAYPHQAEDSAERDHHYAVTQLVSALAADRCVFNSEYNRDSFLEGGQRLLSRMPDLVPSNWIDRIAARSSVLSVPLDLAEAPIVGDVPAIERTRGPVLLWNHRWEYDKGPDIFFAALRELSRRDVPFRVAVCGQQFRQTPEVFQQARAWLGNRVIQWGYLPSRAAYLEVLERAQIVISTARQEFFGISVLEAVHQGARPLVPDALSYRELFPDEYRYRDLDDLVERLATLCRRWTEGDLDLRKDHTALTVPHGASAILPRYARLLADVVG